MKWPWPWSRDKDNRKKRNIYSLEFWTDPKTYLQPEVLFPASAVVVTTLGFIHFYRFYVRRIPESSQIYPNFFRKRSLFGKVTSVGDADNFRLYHTPGGRLLGWGWLRKVPTDPKELKARTVHIRIAGVDAPEAAHFGNPGQPYSAESLRWLNDYIGGKRVRAYLYRRDQYDRIVGSVRIWKSMWPRDVGLEMLRAGVAQVYEAKMGAEFGGKEVKYRQAEAEAKVKRVGIWGLKGKFQSPGNYKKSLREKDFFNPGSANKGSSSSSNNTATRRIASTATSKTSGVVIVVGKSTRTTPGATTKSSNTTASRKISGKSTSNTTSSKAKSTKKC